MSRRASPAGRIAQLSIRRILLYTGDLLPRPVAGRRSIGTTLSRGASEARRRLAQTGVRQIVSRKRERPGLQNLQNLQKADARLQKTVENWPARPRTRFGQRDVFAALGDGCPAWESFLFFIHVLMIQSVLFCARLDL